MGSFSGYSNKNLACLVRIQYEPTLVSIICPSRVSISSISRKSRKMTREIRSRWGHLLAHGLWCHVTCTSSRRKDWFRDFFPRSTRDESSPYSHHRQYLRIQDTGNRRWTHEKYPLSRQARGWYRKRKSDGENTPYTVKIDGFSCIFTVKYVFSVNWGYFSLIFTTHNSLYHKSSKKNKSCSLSI